MESDTVKVRKECLHESQGEFMENIRFAFQMSHEIHGCEFVWSALDGLRKGSAFFWEFCRVPDMGQPPLRDTGLATTRTVTQSLFSFGEKARRHGDKGSQGPTISFHHFERIILLGTNVIIVIRVAIVVRITVGLEWRSRRFDGFHSLPGLRFRHFLCLVLSLIPIVFGRMIDKGKMQFALPRHAFTGNNLTQGLNSFIVETHVGCQYFIVVVRVIVIDVVRNLSRRPIVVLCA